MHKNGSARWINALAAGLAGLLIGAQATAAPPKPDKAAKFALVPYAPGMALADQLRGHDAKSLIGAALKLPKKTDFETDEQYLERLKPLLDKPVSGSVALSSRLIISLPLDKSTDYSMRFGWKFEPASETVSLDTKYFGLSPVDGYKSIESILLSESKQVGTYIGSNSFGVKKTITQYESIDVKVIGLLPEEMESFSTAPTPLARADAEKSLASARVAIIGHLVAPYATRERIHATPAISSPSDLDVLIYRLIFKVEEVVALRTTPPARELLRETVKWPAKE